MGNYKQPDIPALTTPGGEKNNSCIEKNIYKMKLGVFGSSEYINSQ